MEPVCCCVIPPFVLRSIIERGTVEARLWAEHTLEMLAATLATRSGPVAPPSEPQTGLTTIHDAGTHRLLPGTTVYSEGGAPSSDPDVVRAYDGLRATLDFYRTVLGRNSLDDKGLDLVGTVHYGYHFDNAMWDGRQMVFGDGDGVHFRSFTSAVDVMAHELTHGVTQFSGGLTYRFQSGALNESVSDVFGSLVKQYVAGQTAEEADWLIGAGLFTPAVNGVALRSLKAPGTAFDDPVLGKDLQPRTMAGYVKVSAADDSGGVHINSGIPNHAFYLAAKGFGGHAWEQAGVVWYRALTAPDRPATQSFAQFAERTTAVALELFGPSGRDVVANAWAAVGVGAAQRDGWKAVARNVAELVVANEHLSLRSTTDGSVWQQDPTSRNGWLRIPSRPDVVQLVADDDDLYLRHANGTITHRSIGRPGPEVVENLSQTLQIAAGDGTLYRLNDGGQIWAYSGRPHSWTMIATSPGAVQLVAAGSTLLQRHPTGDLWAWGRTPMLWELIGTQPRTVDVVASSARICRLLDDGSVEELTGGSWQVISAGANTSQLTADGDALYQLHRSDGTVWEHLGGTRWREIGRDAAIETIAAASGALFAIHTDGTAWVYAP